MTASTTEQERAHALAEKHGATSYRNRADTSNPAFGFTLGQLEALISEVEQAARRAPAVPVPSRRPTLEEIEEAVGYHSSGWDCVDPSELIDAIMNIAAAPQPPEAAPVELPEPVYTMRVRGRMHDYTPTLSAFDLADGEHALYTEQQVRQLLATAKVERKPLTDEAIRTLYGESDGHWQMVGPQVLCFARSIESVHGIQEQST